MISLLTASLIDMASSRSVFAVNIGAFARDLSESVLPILRKTLPNS